MYDVFAPPGMETDVLDRREKKSRRGGLRSVSTNTLPPLLQVSVTDLY